MHMTKQQLSYEELDRVVLSYQSGKRSASKRLLDAFEGFLVRYLDIIHNGKYDLSDRSTREFIALYMSDTQIRRHIHQYQMKPPVRAEMYKVADNLKAMFNQFERQEIWNELVMAFLTLAKRYNSYDGKPRFHTYVMKVYRYQLRRQLAKLIVDPIAYRYDKSDSPYSDDTFYDPIEGASDMTDAVEFMMEISGQKHVYLEDEFEDEIGDNWVNGYTASESFLTLSKLERRIIKMYYEDELSDQQIANVTGIARATINRRRLVAKEKIERAVRKDNNV